MCHSVSFSASEVATTQNLTISCNSICIIKISAVFLVSTYKYIDVTTDVLFFTFSSDHRAFITRKFLAQNVKNFSCYFKKIVRVLYWLQSFECGCWPSSLLNILSEKLFFMVSVSLISITLYISKFTSKNISLQLFLLWHATYINVSITA